MDEEQQDTIPNNSEDTKIPPTSTTEYVDETTTDIPKSDSGQNNNKKINKEPIQVTVNIPKDENRTATIANKIAIFGLLINLVLAVFTYLLFRKTVEANETSKYSLSEAQKAVDQAKRANDIAESNFKLAQSSSLASDSISRINLNLTKKSVSTQITSIEQAQKTYTIENRPLVQIVDLKIDSIGIGITTKMRFGLTNLGKFPAKLMYAKFGLSHGVNTTVEEAERITGLIDYNIKNSVSSGMTIPITISGRPLEEIEYNEYKKNKSSLFLVGEIFYESFVTEKKFSNKIVYKINSIPDINVVGMKNEDKAH